jgi:8-oxo-dGTP pyrophosphatase MutT (NUDIX family)
MSGTLKPWKVLRSEVALETPWFTIRRDVCETTENTLVPEYYTWQKRDCVIVFPITIDQNVLLIKQYRHGLRHIMIDYPGGTIEAGQSILDAAAAELLEEAGYSAKRFILLGSYAMDSSYSSQRAHFVVAIDCEFAMKITNPNEITDVLTVPITSINEFASREIDCLLCALLTLKATTFMKEKEK